MTIDKLITENLDLDLGVGKITLTSKLTGINEINSGVGETNINLLGIKEDYQIKVDKGIGSIDIDGENILNNTYYGNGTSRVDIDGGIGSINVRFMR